MIRSESAALVAAAAKLGRRAAHGKRLPRLLFFTDPGRVADPEAVAQTLPRGAAIVFRAFGAADAEARAARLKAIARRRGLLLLIGADAALAARVGADGVHLPQRLAARTRALRTARPDWILTVAAHDLGVARRAAAWGADAVVVSPIFASASPSASRPLGPTRLARIVRAAGGPVYALGGVNGRTVNRLRGTGIAGLAAVEALAGSALGMS